MCSCLYSITFSSTSRSTSFSNNISSYSGWWWNCRRISYSCCSFRNTMDLLQFFQLLLLPVEEVEQLCMLPMVGLVDQVEALTGNVVEAIQADMPGNRKYSANKSSQGNSGGGGGTAGGPALVPVCAGGGGGGATVQVVLEKLEIR
jgi:hypothetical protein